MSIKEIQYMDALKMAVCGDREDIFVMSPVPVGKLKIDELRERIECGAVFAVITNESETAREAAEADEPLMEPPDEEIEEVQQEKRSFSRKPLKIDVKRVAELKIEGCGMAEIARDQGVTSRQFASWKYNHAEEVNRAIEELKGARELAERIFGKGDGE